MNRRNHPQRLLAGLSPFFYVTAVTLGAGVVAFSLEQSEDLERAAHLSTVVNKATSAVANVGRRALRLGYSMLLLTPPEMPSSDYTRALDSARDNGGTATVFSAMLAVAAGAFVAFLRAFVLKSDARGRCLAVRHLCYTSLVLFCVGVGATALSLIASKDMPVIGSVVFKFESKGIAQTIMKLFSSGNAFLGSLIFLFSIAVPLAKVGLTLFATYTRGPSQKKALKIIKAVGKWSMADVFVIAVLLAFFAMGGDEFTDAWVGPGVYFFAAYCILSMWAGVWLVYAAEHEDHAALIPATSVAMPVTSTNSQARVL